jgi:site-specific DNA recombinase
MGEQASSLVIEQTPRRTALYMRVSTDRQEDGSSLQTQEEGCRRVALERGYVVDEEQVYRETFSGIHLWERPQLTALREAIRQHLIDVVLVHSIDRLARNPVHLGVVLSEAEYRGVEIVFVTEPLDHTPEGELVRYMRGYAAQIEHEKIVERNVRGHRARAEAGKLLPGGTGKALYGYSWADEKSKSAYIPNEAEAAIVRRIFASAATGTSLRSIALELTAKGIPTPSGGQVWGRSTVYAILMHPFYSGHPVAYRWETRARKTRSRLTGELRTVSSNRERPLEEHITLPPEAVPALISAEIAEAVKSRLTLNKAQAQRNNHHPEDTLLRNGFAICGYCGNNLVATHARGAGYACLQNGPGKALYISARILDTHVWQIAQNILTNPKIIAEQLKTMKQDPIAASLVELDRQIADLTKRQANTARGLALLETDEARKPVIAELNRLATQKSALEADREELQRQHQTWKERQAQLRDIKAWCQQVATRLETLTYTQKRLALLALGFQVRVYREDHNPRFEIEANVPLAGGQFRSAWKPLNSGDSAQSAGAQ